VDFSGPAYKSVARAPRFYSFLARATLPWIGLLDSLFSQLSFSFDLH